MVLGTATGADDVVQDADMRAWRARSTIDPARGFVGWYLRVVANAGKNARRSWGRRAALEVRDARRSSSTSPDPADHVVTDAERRAVIAAVNRLGRNDRLIIGLRHFEQLSETEMAEVLGCATGTVKSRLSRAMARLRRQLDEFVTEDAG